MVSDPRMMPKAQEGPHVYFDIVGILFRKSWEINLKCFSKNITQLEWYLKRSHWSRTNQVKLEGARLEEERQ